MANLSLRSQPCIGSALVTRARSTGPGVVELRGRSGRRKLYRVGGETEMTEDSADGAREHDSRDETHAAAAVGALQHVDLETSAHELGPGPIAWAGDLRGSARGRPLRGFRSCSEANYLASPPGVRCEHAVIDDEVHVGARNQSRELFEKLLRAEGDVTRPVAPGRLEAEEDASVGRK